MKLNKTQVCGIITLICFIAAMALTVLFEATRITDLYASCTYGTYGIVMWVGTFISGGLLTELLNIEAEEL